MHHPCRHILILGVLCASVCLASADVLGPAAAPAPVTPPAVDTKEPAASSPVLRVPERYASHPLLSVARKMMAGEFGDQPQWRLSLLLKGLDEEPRSARLTAYSSRCPDGGGTGTRWGTRVRPGICAADPSYWGPGSVIWVCDPVAQILIVEDTGSAVKGQNRFDICLGDDAEACERFGVQRLSYIPLRVAPPQRSWGTCPSGWEPPAPPLSSLLDRLALAGVFPPEG